MTRVPSSSPPDAGGVSAPAAPCPQCGGSGTLRLDDHRYRTCLDCLGQGQQLRASSGTLFVPRVSVAASVSAAG